MNYRLLSRVLFFSLVFTTIQPAWFSAKKSSKSPFESFKEKMSKLSNMAKDDTNFLWQYGQKKRKNQKVTDKETARANKLLIRAGITLGVLLIIIGTLIGAAVMYKQSGSGSSGIASGVSLEVALNQMTVLVEDLLKTAPNFDQKKINDFIAYGSTVINQEESIKNSSNEIREMIKNLGKKALLLSNTYSAMVNVPTTLEDMTAKYMVEMEKTNPLLDAAQIYPTLGLTIDQGKTMSLAEIIPYVDRLKDWNYTYYRQIPYIFGYEGVVIKNPGAKKVYDDWLSSKVPRGPKGNFQEISEKLLYIAAKLNEFA